MRLDASERFKYNCNEMRIGLISDTHVPVPIKELPITELARAFHGVDLILHAGDIYDISVLNDLEKIAPVLSARGDDDYGPTARDVRVQEKHVLKFGEHVIWLMHQRPFVPLMTNNWWENGTNSQLAEFGKPSIVVFGHEHRTVVETVGGVLFINPGSPTFLEYQYGLGTYGILDMGLDKPDVSISHL